MKGVHMHICLSVSSKFPKERTSKHWVLSNAWPILIFLNTKPSKVFVKKDFMALAYQKDFEKLMHPLGINFSFLNVSLVTNFGNNCLIFISVKFQNI